MANSGSCHALHFVFCEIFLKTHEAIVASMFLQMNIYLPAFPELSHVMIFFAALMHAWLRGVGGVVCFETCTFFSNPSMIFI